ncbi:MAG TPA: alpha/beta hydrolase [Ktedonobacterales bacterium]
MSDVTSKDGTTIAYDQTGSGPAVVIVGNVLGDRSQQAPLAALLAPRFTVFNYDRRGHGASGNTEPYAVEREFEDLDAILDAAGGSAFVYGTSGPGVLALYAAGSGIAPKIKKLAIWEPPFILEGSGRQAPKDYQQRLTSLMAEGRRGDMVELFFVEAVGMPAELVAQMRQAPWWSAQEALAPTLIQNAEIMGDFSMPAERVAKVTTPTLVIDGGETPWLSYAAQAVADTLPHAERRTISGQPHNVAPEAVAPVLEEYFSSQDG